MKQLQHQNHWESLAALSYRNELDFQLRGLTSSVFCTDSKASGRSIEPSSLLVQWKETKHSLINRWQQTLTDIRESKICDYAVFSVALSNLTELS